MSKKEDFCSFCGRDDVPNLVEGRDAFICLECAVACSQYEDTEARTFQMQTPSKIKEHLDQYVVGQENAKKVLSVAVHNHYKRIENQDIDITKSNILLIGDTGTGKTLLAQVLANFINVPIVVTDATSLTEAGYVGEDVENILVRLLQACDHNLKEAEQGIIFVDELDKISRKSENASITRDVSGEGVQQALLKVIEGAEVNIPPRGGRKHPDKELLKINTKNILFILGGAFDGLDKIIKQRTEGTSVGFLTLKDKEAKKNQEVYSDDLVKFGLIPELVGRMPVVAQLQPLSKDDLVDILVKPKNSIIGQYKVLFKMEGAELEFEKEALEAIAEEAIRQKTGARGLRRILERILLDTMYNLPDSDNVKQVLVNKDVLLREKAPLILKKKCA